jgi:uncharacterized zinc-type alcohol dehydrogenase-like protein
MKVRGIAALAASAPLVPFEFERRDVGVSDVAFDISYAGICHSDIHQAREEWGPSLFPMVPGHEIVGIVTETGSAVTKFKKGDRIGVGVFIDLLPFLRTMQIWIAAILRIRNDWDLQRL